MTASMQVISYAKVINIEKRAQGRPNGFIPDEALGRPVEMFLGAWVPLVACGTLPDATLAINALLGRLSVAPSCRAETRVTRLARTLRRSPQ